LNELQNEKMKYKNVNFYKIIFKLEQEIEGKDWKKCQIICNA